MSVTTKYKYIDFAPYKASDSKHYWWCLNRRAGNILGWVDYYYTWHKYVFVATSDNVVFSAECLREIADFMEQLSRKEGKDADENRMD